MVKIANENHVTMVDDNEGDVVLARNCLELSTLTNPWLSFPDGPNFLHYLHEVKDGAEPMPAIVLLDLNMPRMSGFDVLAEVRRDSFFDDLPIFCVLTSSADDRDRARAEEFGVSGFVTKPGSLDNYIDFFNSLAPD